MSYDPKEGDKVRIIVESEVIGTDRRGIETMWTYIPYVEIASVEKVAPPLPTEPGVYVREHADFPLHELVLYVLTSTGRWYLAGEQIEPPKGDLTRLVRES